MGEDFDRSAFGLHPCQVRVAHGLIFICLAEPGDPEIWDVTTIKDTRIIIDNQKGVNSGHYRPGPHAPAESYPAAFTRWYLERLAS